jgi:hypothetical protein
VPSRVVVLCGAQADSTFYILDAMCWRGYSLCVPRATQHTRVRFASRIGAEAASAGCRACVRAFMARSYDCTTEFRLYWLQTKLAELAAEPPPPPQVRVHTRRWG